MSRYEPKRILASNSLEAKKRSRNGPEQSNTPLTWKTENPPKAPKGFYSTTTSMAHFTLQFYFARQQQQKISNTNSLSDHYTRTTPTTMNSFFFRDRKFLWCILFVGTIICFVPCMSGWEPDGIWGSTNGLYHAMKSRSYALNFSLIFSMGAFCQILLEICADIKVNLISKPSTIMYNKSLTKVSATQALRVILIAAVFLPNLLILISGAGLKQLIFLDCFFQSSMIWVLCLVVDQIKQYGQSIIRSRMLILSALFSTTAVVMLSWSPYGGANENWYFLAFVVSVGISIFFAAMILVPWFRSLPAKPLSAFGTSQLSCLLNVMWIVVLGTILLAVNIAAWIYPNDNVPYAALSVYMKTISMLILLVAQRHAKHSRNVMKVAAETIACTQHLFVRLISHELRTPLNSVYMGLDMIRTEMVDKVCCADSFEVLDDVRKSCEFTEDILDDLLSGLKLEKGIMFLDKTSVSAFAFALDCVTPHYLPAMAAEVTLILEPSRITLAKELKSVTFHADRKKLGQLMKNLVGNAIKFTPCGGFVTVTVGVVPVTGWRKISRSCKRVLRIDVTDTGRGMTQEEMLCAFSEKESELPSGGPRGGLWICKSIVDLHGGELSVSSYGKHQGCTFTVLLPASEGNGNGGTSASCPSYRYKTKVSPTGAAAAAADIVSTLSKSVSMSMSMYASSDSDNDNSSNNNNNSRRRNNYSDRRAPAEQQHSLQRVKPSRPSLSRQSSSHSHSRQRKITMKTTKSNFDLNSFHSIASIVATDSHSSRQLNLCATRTSSSSSSSAAAATTEAAAMGFTGERCPTPCSTGMYASSHIPLDLYMSSPSRGEHNNSDCNRTHLRVKPLRVISISHHHSEETQFMLPLPLACSNMSSCEHNTENTTTVNANVNNNIIINTSIKANTTAITVVNRPKLENHILRHQGVARYQMFRMWISGACFEKVLTFTFLE
eukprot:gene9229-19142_t